MIVAPGRFPVPGVDPDALSNLVRWYKNDTLGAVGSSISSWTDSSATADHAVQATGSKQPTVAAGINGRKAASFDGGDVLTSAATMTFKPGTLIAAVSLTSAGYRAILGGPASDGMEVRANPSATLEMVRQGVALIGTSTTALVAGTPAIVTARYTNAGVWTFRINGTECGTGTNSVAIGTKVVTLGANTDSAGEPWLGYIGEEAIYDIAHADADILTVEQRLGAKFGIAVP